MKILLERRYLEMIAHIDNTNIHNVDVNKHF